MSYTFSVIIPHKNIPRLLERCLASIPLRDDLEIIIVDDNSDPNIVDFEHFPGKGRPNTTVIFDKSGKGAGRARNIGLQHAQGKWLVFADADDFFVEDSDKILDDYCNTDVDIVYFKHLNVLSENVNVKGDRCYAFTKEMESDDRIEEKELFFRYRHNVPWAKLIRHSFVKKRNIHFEEIKYSNDILFNIQAGCYASKVLLVNRFLYVLTNRSDSLTGGNCSGIEELVVRAKAHIRMQVLLEQFKYEKAVPAMWFLPILYSRDKKKFVLVLKYYKEKKLSMSRLFRMMSQRTNTKDTLLLFTLFIFALLPFGYAKER